ncbi:MAG: hypothetical protein WKF96_01610 [Solirubrobacteraceae bacterium]
MTDGPPTPGREADAAPDSSLHAAKPAALKPRARRALIARLTERLDPERAALMDGSGRTATFEDNLVASLSAEQVATLRAQLSTGDGNELTPGKDGQRPDAHAAHSSAALACNAFGAWIGREEQLVIDGIDRFTEQLRVEAKQPIFRGGRPPNLDCLLVGPDVAVGVESKLTEPLARHSPATWSEAYGRDSCRALLSDGWLKALDDARAGTYAPTYLDIDQLLKHALGLRKQHPQDDVHLVYVYWEPTDGSELLEVRAHRKEVQELLGRVGEASPRLHALTYRQLWDEWQGLPGLPWLTAHLDELRGRYDTAVY